MGFVTPQLMDAYIPLSMGGWITPGHRAAALAIAPNIAVTNAHNENLIPPDRILARSDYDILFYRTEKTSALRMAKPVVGEDVIAYGQGRNGVLLEARGKVLEVDVQVMSRCPGCRQQRAFYFDRGAGPGFSGGPVVDAKTGAVVGLVFGYCDRDDECGGPRSVAFDIETVIAEMHRLVASSGP